MPQRSFTHTSQRGDFRDKARGAILGGAIGDALGASVEFTDLAGILTGTGGEALRSFAVARFASATGYGLVTDDTQLTLFTLDGLIRAGHHATEPGVLPLEALHRSYHGWYKTQILAGPGGELAGWLQHRNWLYSERAPGNTCIEALENLRPEFYGTRADNLSKGCGAVMRSAPFGLLLPAGFLDSDGVYALAVQAAGLTHGHPTAQAAAGTLAVLVGRLAAGDDLDTALNRATTVAATAGADETVHAVQSARTAAARNPGSAAEVERLGDGWNADEALGIAVYAALSHADSAHLMDALALAVTHSGDSDSTGSLCGNILGALHGMSALPPSLAAKVEGRRDIIALTDDFVRQFTDPPQRETSFGRWWSHRFPPGLYLGGDGPRSAMPGTGGVPQPHVRHLPARSSVNHVR